MYAGMLADGLARSGRAKNVAAVDHLTGAALGLPAAYGTPLVFLAQRGRRRVEYYARAHWPRLYRSRGDVSPASEAAQEGAVDARI
jgi:hypothetical protein